MSKRKIKFFEVCKIFTIVSPPVSNEDNARYERDICAKLTEAGYDPDEVASYLVEKLHIPLNLSPKTE